MLSVTEAYRPVSDKVYFIVKNEGDLAHVTLKKLLGILPDIKIFFFDAVSDEVYASLSTKDKRLPLAVAADKDLNVSVISTGYNIGSAEQLLAALTDK